MTIEQINPSEQYDHEIFQRVAEHSKKFDQHIEQTRIYPRQEIINAWQTREWQIGDTQIQAIGLSHVPETFLEYRSEIEKSIQESDIVFTEFAPEALGFYDKSSSQQFSQTPAKHNSHYSVEDLRQVYLKYERSFNIGIFHHEIELLAAKYSKPMAIADLRFSMPAEKLLQETHFYYDQLKEIHKDKDKLTEYGLYTCAFVLGASGLNDLLQSKEKITRRDFMVKAGKILAGSTLAGFTPLIMEKKHKHKQTKYSSNPDSQKLKKLVDPILSDSLYRLSELGYKKICFIYGTMHLDPIEKINDNPEQNQEFISRHYDAIKKNNPNYFKIFKLDNGENYSDQFTASDNKVWKQINQ